MWPSKSRSVKGSSIHFWILRSVCVLILIAGVAVLLSCQPRPSHVAEISKGTPDRPEQSIPIEPVKQQVKTKEEQQPGPPQPEPADEQPMTVIPKSTTEPEVPVSQHTEPIAQVLPNTAGDFSEVTKGNPNSRKIALTFDAGASPLPTPDILDILARHGIHATFFLTGAWIEKNPDLTCRIANEGHEIGNHTFSHKGLTKLTARETMEELERTEQLMLKLTGRSTKPLVRVPYGVRDKRVISVLSKAGYRSIYWNLDSWDGFKKDITPDEIKQRVLSKVSNGSIILFHCGSRATADTLDSILQQLLSEGYEPVTISDLLSNQ